MPEYKKNVKKLHELFYIEYTLLKILKDHNSNVFVDSYPSKICQYPCLKSYLDFTQMKMFYVHTPYLFVINKDLHSTVDIPF